MLRFSKWIILQFFLLIIMVVWNIKQTIMKDYNVQSCQWMAYDRFRQPTQDHHDVGYVKNIYNLLWLAEYQCKGVIKINLSDLFFWCQFRISWKRLNWKNLFLTLIAATRIINFDWCIFILQFKCFKFQIFIFYFRPTLFFKKQVIINFFSLNFTSIETEGEKVSSSQNERTLGWSGGWGASKFGDFERTYFLNVPLCNTMSQFQHKKIVSDIS